jgi:hypothetical protein
LDAFTQLIEAAAQLAQLRIVCGPVQNSVSGGCLPVDWHAAGIAVHMRAVEDALKEELRIFRGGAVAAGQQPTVAHQRATETRVPSRHWVCEENFPRWRGKHTLEKDGVLQTS